MSRGSISHNYEYIPGYSNALQKINSSRILLKFRQQPVQTRLSTNNERDRRPLDPPPIVQIELENSSLQETQDFLQNPYLFMCVSLVHSSTHEDIISTTQNTLSGQTTSSMYKLKDINNQDGGFFVFGDLSVKLEGQFRLKFSIFEITGLFVTNLKSIYSNTFQVYSSKTFPGMLESTFLSRSFSDQGVRIRIRKEHRVQIAGSRKRKLSQDDLDRSRQQPPSMYPEQRRSSMGHRSLPFSPPHQSYDQYRNSGEHLYYDKIYQQQQHRLMTPPYRRTSMEDKIPLRRQSADPQYHPSRLHLNVPRRMSLQQQQQQQHVPPPPPPFQPSCLYEEIIHLPPLRSMISKQQQQQQQQQQPQDGIVEVDAAVAMMQLRQQ